MGNINCVSNRSEQRSEAPGPCGCLKRSTQVDEHFETPSLVRVPSAPTSKADAGYSFSPGGTAMGYVPYQGFDPTLQTLQVWVAEPDIPPDFSPAPIQSFEPTPNGAAANLDCGECEDTDAAEEQVRRAEEEARRAEEEARREKLPQWMRDANVAAAGAAAAGAALAGAAATNRPTICWRPFGSHAEPGEGLHAVPDGAPPFFVSYAEPTVELWGNSHFLSALPYRELQQRAKAAGIKANQKAAVLVQELAARSECVY